MFSFPINHFGSSLRFSGHAMVAGLNSALYYSSNGTSFTNRSNKWPGPFSSFSHGGQGDDDGAGTVIVPFGRRLLKSTNGGANWIMNNHPSPGLYVSTVKYLNGRWICATTLDMSSGDKVNFWSSTNGGVTWSVGSGNFGNIHIIRDFDYDTTNSLYIGCGDGTGANSPSVYTSSNGTSWTQRTVSVGSKKLSSIAFGNATSVVVGASAAIAYSTNGTTWTNATPAASYTGNFCDIVYGNSTYGFMAVGVSGLGIQRSTDGITWTACALPASATDLFCVEYDPTGDVYIVSGTDGTNKVWTTSDGGANWTARSLSTPLASGTDYGDMIYDSTNDRFVLVGPGRLGTGATATAAEFQAQTAADAITWTRNLESGLPAEPSIYSVDVNPSSGLWVFVGAGGVIYTSSDNGATITARTSGTTNALWCVRYNATKGWMAVGENGTTVRSADGTTWTNNTSVGAAVDFRSVACDGTSWVAVENSNTQCYTSTDNSSWTARTVSATSVSLYSIAFGNSVFCAVGEESNAPRIYTSPDGTTWTLRTNPTTTATEWHCVTFYDGRFRLFSPVNDQHSSSDGVTWTDDNLSLPFTMSAFGIEAGSNAVSGAVASTGAKAIIAAIDNPSQTGLYSAVNSVSSYVLRSSSIRVRCAKVYTTA